MSEQTPRMQLDDDHQFSVFYRTRNGVVTFRAFNFYWDAQSFVEECKRLSYPHVELREISPHGTRDAHDRRLKKLRQELEAATKAVSGAPDKPARHKRRGPPTSSSTSP